MRSALREDSSVEPTFNDPVYRRKLAGTARLSGPQRYLAYGRLDLDLAPHAAPLAAFGDLTSHDFFSARIGRQTYGCTDWPWRRSASRPRDTERQNRRGKLAAEH